MVIGLASSSLGGGSRVGRSLTLFASHISARRGLNRSSGSECRGVGSAKTARRERRRSSGNECSGGGEAKTACQSAKEPHPIFYSLDVFLPFADLQQKKTWVLDEKARYFSWYEAWYLGEGLAGWVLTALVATAATGLLKR
jgi:hypothetical protein